MQSEQKVKVGLIKSAIKLSSEIKLLHVAINQKSQNSPRLQRHGNESVNMFHYCMITQEKIKSQNNCYKLDLTCFMHYLGLFHIPHFGAATLTHKHTQEAFFSTQGCFCIFRQSVTRGLLLMNRGESAGSGEK